MNKNPTKTAETSLPKVPKVKMESKNPSGKLCALVPSPACTAFRISSGGKDMARNFEKETKSGFLSFFERKGAFRNLKGDIRYNFSLFLLESQRIYTFKDTDFIFPGSKDDELIQVFFFF